MEKIKILVVEDEILIADNICDTLNDLGYITFEPAINYTEALIALEHNKPDIVILDINLSGSKTGLDVAKVINNKHQIPFIFLTSNSDAATVSDVKKVRPSAFLIKPFTKEELYSAVEIALYNTSLKQKFSDSDKPVVNKGIFIKEKDTYIKVFFNEIVFIKSDHVYVELNLLGKKAMVIRSGLVQILEKLPNTFIRVHRGYIINTLFLEKVTTNSLVVSNTSIPIGGKYKNNLTSYIKLF